MAKRKPKTKREIMVEMKKIQQKRKQAAFFAKMGELINDGSEPRKL